jgi:hypothetical protein
MAVPGAGDVAGMVSSMLGGGQMTQEQANLRTEVGRLTHGASRYADTSGCTCDGCDFLRQASDLMMPTPKRKGPASATSNRDQPDAEPADPPQ